MAITSQLGYTAGITFLGADETTKALAYLQDESIGGGPYTLYAKIRVPYSAPAAASIVAIGDADGAAAPGVVALMMVDGSLTAVMGGVVMSASGLTEGNNVHIALTRNGSTGILYVDGVQAATSSGFGGSVLGDYLIVGNYDDKNWVDRIYRVSLFNRALSEEEIMKLGKHGVHEGDRWGTTTDGGTPGCVLDLDLSIGVGRHFPDRSPNTLGADATPGIEHVLRTSYGLRTVVQRLNGDEMSDEPGETFLLELPPNCGIIGVEFDVESGLGGDTLSIGTAGAPSRFVEDQSVPSGITWADSLEKVSQSNNEFTPVYVTRSSTGGGLLRIRTIYEVRGLPSNPPEEPPPPGPTITAVFLSATPLVVEPGGTSALEALVTGTGAFNPFVEFSIMSGDGDLTDVTGDTATLTVNTEEAVTVRATSSQDPSKWDEETVTVEVDNVLGDVPTSVPVVHEWTWSGYFGFTDTPGWDVERFRVLSEVHTTGNPGEIFRHEETQDATAIGSQLAWSGPVGHLSSVVGSYSYYDVTVHDDPFAVGPGVPSYTPGFGTHWTANSNTQAEANKATILTWYTLQDLSDPYTIEDAKAGETFPSSSSPVLTHQEIVLSSDTFKLIRLHNIEYIPEDPPDHAFVSTNSGSFSGTPPDSGYKTYIHDLVISFNVNITGTGPKTFRWRFQFCDAFFNATEAGPWHYDEILSGTTSADIEFICSDELAFWQGSTVTDSDTFICFIRVELV